MSIETNLLLPSIAPPLNNQRNQPRLLIRGKRLPVSVMHLITVLIPAQYFLSRSSFSTRMCVSLEPGCGEVTWGVICAGGREHAMADRRYS